jgi:large subunit ribosomal protein L3
MFKPGEKIQVRGTTIGKGFQGTIKRWNFHRGPMSHGSKSHRLPGALSGHTEPGHVFKGKKMAGHLGDEKVTVKNLVIVEVDEAQGLLLVRGAVPGADKGICEIRSAGKLEVVATKSKAPLVEEVSPVVSTSSTTEEPLQS